MLRRQFPLRAVPIVLALSACSAQEPETGQEPQPRASREVLQEAGKNDCLLMIWSAQEDRDVDFDRTHDKVDGGAISCATGTSASRFDRAIVGLRTAARTRDKSKVLDQLGMPLTYIDARGQRRELKDRAEVDAVFDEVFDAEMLETLAGLDLKDMAVSGGGGSFALGSVWLVVDKDGGQPRLVTVNRQALAEAAQAAHSKAERNKEEPSTFDE